MVLSELMTCIVKKQEKPYFIFVGEDTCLIDLYLNNLVKSFNYKTIKSDSVENAFKTLNGSLIQKEKKIAIIRGDNDFLKNEKGWKRLKEETKNIYILIYTDLSKHQKFKNEFNNNIVVFEKVKDEFLIKQTQQMIDLNDENAKKLVELTKCNYGYLLNEIDKIQNYCESTNKDINKGFVELLKNKQIGQEENDLNDVVDSLLNKDYKDILTKLKDINSLLIINKLFSTIKNLLIIKSNDKSTDLMQITNLTQKAINYYRYKKIAYNTTELKNCLLNIIEVEQGIKEGKIPEEISIEYLLVNLC